jgi:hypothetical protein
MMNDYYVFDDILSKEEQELLYDYVNTNPLGFKPNSPLPRCRSLQ